MKFKVIVGIMLTLLFIGVLTLAFNIQSVEASGTIYIRADGSVEPDTAPISSVDNVTYTLTSNITSEADGIVVEKDNIIVDGAGYILQTTAVGVFSKGIDLTERYNVTIRNVQIKSFYYGVYLYESSSITISGNTITNNYYGIWLDYSSNNNIFENKVTDNSQVGVYLDFFCLNNNIFGNNVTNNYKGITLSSSSSYNIISDNTVSARAAIGLDSSSYNIISRNNVTSDGGSGIWLDSSSYNIISENDIRSEGFRCITLSESSNNNIYQNNMTKSGWGLELYGGSEHNIISRNEIYRNSHGIVLRYDNNIIFGNNIVGHTQRAVSLSSADNNIFYHNNFVDNIIQVMDIKPDYPSSNIWDYGYPCGGNYWSDYPGIDEQSGFGQDQPGSDGIVDTPYVIDGNNVDRFPLAAPINIFDAGTWNEVVYYVDVISDSTVSDFYFNPDEGAFIRFNVTSQSGTAFCRVTIPKDLLWVENGWTVIVGSESVEYTIIPDENFTYLYFTCDHSTKMVQIEGTHVIPEFSSFMIMSLFMITTLLAVIAFRRKYSM